MDMQPNDISVKLLLNSGSQFSIPRFQRDYSWDKKNYQEFIDDMINCLTIENNELKTQSYFLGTMLFIGDFIDKNKVDKYIHVVDGQQRLTTITILFSALSDRFRTINENILSEQLFKYIIDKNDDGKDYKVLDSKTHYPYFSYFIQDITKVDAKTQKVSTEEEQLIKESFDYLYDRLSENSLRSYLKKNIGSEKVDQVAYVDILKTLRDQVLGTIFIAITTPDKKNANMIFEILNAKGKKLSHVDLIKNKIFEVLDQEVPADYAEVMWDKIKSILISRKETVGLATYYRHFWISKYKKSTANKLYDDFLLKIKPKNESRYKSFLEELECNAIDYIKILNPSRADYANRKEYFWLVQSLDALMNTFNIVQVRVALLALFQMKDQGYISSKVFKSTVLYLENFHFAYNAIASGRANKFEKIYADFAISLRMSEDKTEAHDNINNLLIKPLDSLFPDFEQFSSNFVLLTFTKQSKPNNIKTKYALQKLNALFDNSELFSDVSSIEHIHPEDSDGITVNIGNLITLEESLNNEAGCISYSNKRDIYKKSNFLWVNKFAVDNEGWEESDIDDRAKELAKIYYSKILNKNI